MEQKVTTPVDTDSLRNSAMVVCNYTLQRPDFEFAVDLEIPCQGITGIYGVSGSGKTTLLRCIAGLEPTARGRLVVAGDVWQDSQSSIFVPVHKRSIGYVFQEPQLFEHLTVEDNLRYGQRRIQTARVIDIGQVIDLLDLAPLLGRKSRDLSGGETQRVAIGRALLRSPRLVLMDEPLAALDRARRDEILPFLDRLHARLSVPILYVSHNIDEVCRLCDHLVVMERGMALASGAIQSVLVRLDIAELGSDEAGSVVQGSVESYDADYDLTRVRFSGGVLVVPGSFDAENTAVRIRIRAADVSLCREKPMHTTILNILPVTIDKIHRGRGPHVLARLRAGDDLLTAKITRRSCDELKLSEGDALLAQIKSVAVKSSTAPLPALSEATSDKPEPRSA